LPHHPRASGDTTDGFFVRVGFANSCALRAPTTSKFFGYTPSEKFERGSYGKPVARRNGLPQDRRLRADGFIIRAQAAIRADGFRPRKFGDGLSFRHP
jgi:hypothetical protein